MVQRIKAWNLFEPDIEGIVEQVDAVLAIFCMENEIRKLRGMEHFLIPVLTPHTHMLENQSQLEAYSNAVDNEVKTIFEETHKPERMMKHRGKETERTR